MNTFFQACFISAVTVVVVAKQVSTEFPSNCSIITFELAVTTGWPLFSDCFKIIICNQDAITIVV